MFKKKLGQKYTGALVLGINDALVEMLGALTGFTFALSDSSLIASAGFITGIAASLSMTASEYLAVSEDKDGNPYLAAAYTGAAYFVSVFLLIVPYFVFASALKAWVVSLFIAIGIIALYNLYVSHLKKISFMPRFLRMLGVSLGVAFVSFAIGSVVHNHLF